jgi:hypothetical protein
MSRFLDRSPSLPSQDAHLHVGYDCNRENVSSADDAVHYEEVFIPIQRMRRVEVFTPVVAIDMSRHREADTIYPGMYGSNVRYRPPGRPSGMRAVPNRAHALHLDLICKRAGHRPLHRA